MTWRIPWLSFSYQVCVAFTKLEGKTLHNITSKYPWSTPHFENALNDRRCQLHLFGSDKALATTLEIWKETSCQGFARRTEALSFRDSSADQSTCFSMTWFHSSLHKALPESYLQSASFRVYSSGAQSSLPSVGLRSPLPCWPQHASPPSQWCVCTKGLHR